MEQKTSESTAKKTAKPAAKKAAAKKVVAPVTEEPVRKPIDFVAEEAATKKAVAKDDKVIVVIERMDGSPYWECCVNGVWYRYARGIEIEIPRTMQRMIESSARLMEINNKLEKEYEGSGVDLNNPANRG